MTTTGTEILPWAGDPAERPDVVRCPDGPMLVRGAVTVTTEDGVEHHSTRPVCAVCRCGATSKAPWCDGTHKALARRTPSAAAAALAAAGSAGAQGLHDATLA